MGRKHSEEAVLPNLQRKGLLINTSTRQIGLPSEVQVGNGTWGKLDFMSRICGWKIIKNATKEDVGLGKNPVQFKTKNSNFKKKEGKDPMKENFKKKQQNKRV